MFNKPLLQVVNVAAGAVATLRIPAEQLTLVGVKLKITGGVAMDNTKIDRIRVKVGPRVIWDLTGAQLRAINAYKNGAAVASYLLLDFTERDQAIFPVKEVGGLDLMALLPVGEVYIEIFINAAAATPAITAQGYYERSQGNGAVLKYMPFSFSQAAAGKFTLPLSLRGAMMKRAWNFYTGTDWSATIDGNFSRFECKKNGLVFFDQTNLDARFDQVQNKKVPQSLLYVADFIVDNNHDAHVATMRNTAQNQLVYDAFEFNAYLTDAGGASVTTIVEVLDAVTNL